MLLLSLKTHGETMDFPPAEAELVKLFAGTGEPPIMEAAALAVSS